jgi:hypothetical protein
VACKRVISGGAIERLASGAGGVELEGRCQWTNWNIGRAVYMRYLGIPGCGFWTGTDSIGHAPESDA